MSLRYTRNLFLRSFCIVYLFAFTSFYIQIPGLYGDNGILPAKSVLENSKHKTLSQKIHYQPTLLWLAPYLGLDISYAMDILALLGSFLAFTGFVSQKFCTIPLFAGLWSLYFSLYQVGQVFVTNNYDEFLLEAGFLAILVAPLLPSRRRVSKSALSDTISFWIVRWLLFRFMLTCGLSKLISGCPKWWSLTSFDHYFESQPLPTPLAWYFHNIPSWYLRLFAVFANVCEMGLPLLFLIPLQSVKTINFCIQLFLQIWIILTGNYNFTNLLMVTLSLSLLDDQFFYKRKTPSSSWNLAKKILTVVIYGILLLGIVKLYSLNINGSVIDSKIAFTKSDFQKVLETGLPLTIYVAIVSMALTWLYTMYTVLFQTSNVRFVTILSTTLCASLAFLLFIATTVPLASLHKTANSTIPSPVRSTYNRLNKIHAVNQYGLFKQMVGVDGRREIILEWADSIEGPWFEYNFLYKPGNVNHSMPFVAPYSPRLDWQMFWAAQSTYDKHPWILSLAHRLLEGKAEVLGLLDRQRSQFAQKPPKYIRALLYNYRFSAWSQRSQSNWWVRQRVGEYFPVYTKESPALIDYLRARNILPSQSKQGVNLFLKQVLDGIRYVTGHLEATLLLWSVFTAGCAIITTSAKK